jgi:hypothetical protein
LIYKNERYKFDFIKNERCKIIVLNLKMLFEN